MGPPLGVWPGEVVVVEGPRAPLRRVADALVAIGGPAAAGGGPDGVRLRGDVVRGTRGAERRRRLLLVDLPACPDVDGGFAAVRAAVAALDARTGALVLLADAHAPMRATACAALGRVPSRMLRLVDGRLRPAGSVDPPPGAS